MGRKQSLQNWPSQKLVVMMAQWSLRDGVAHGVKRSIPGSVQMVYAFLFEVRKNLIPRPLSYQSRKKIRSRDNNQKCALDVSQTFLRNHSIKL